MVNYIILKQKDSELLKSLLEKTLSNFEVQNPNYLPNLLTKLITNLKIISICSPKRGTSQKQKQTTATPPQK